MSLFITFEGGEGSGKSTQAAILVRRLRAAGYDVTSVHEPGTTELGEYLRELLKRESSDDRAMSPEAELLLFAAARAELVERMIRPALDRNFTHTILGSGIGTINLPPFSLYSDCCCNISSAKFHGNNRVYSGIRANSSSGGRIGWC